VNEYIEKSQLATYEGQRAMFEAYSRNKYYATGLIQWMLNNAFSEMIWHLYDIYLDQGGGYYGSKKACEDLHIMYSYNDESIWVVNSLYEVTGLYRARVVVYDTNANVLYNRSLIVGPFGPDSSNQIFGLPKVPSLSSTYFLRLTLFSSSQNVVSENVYWLSTRADVLDFKKSTWFNTPCTQYADFSLLQSLPVAKITYSFNVTDNHDGNLVLSVTISNPTPYIAFFVHVRAIRSSALTNILPIFWDDNYITIFPGERNHIAAVFSKADVGNDKPSLIVSGWNTD